MSYYQPQMGDYYGRGDPGFLSDIWKKIKRPVKIAAGYMLGGPAGAGIMAGMTQPKVGAMPGGAFGFAGTPGTMGPPVPGPSGVRCPRPIIPLSPGGCCPTGYHPAKDGQPKCVRNRRMNITNPRALRRSMRRVQGFEKLAKRTISFTKRVRLKGGARK